MRVLFVLGLLLWSFALGFGQTTDAEKAWTAFQEASKPPQAPLEWRTTRPSEEAIAAFRKTEGERLGKAADLAKDFYTKYPANTNVAEAKTRERTLLETAIQLGNTNVATRLAFVEMQLLNDPKTTTTEKFEIRAKAIQRAAFAKESEGRQAMVEEFEKGVRTLQKEFPNEPGVYEMLLGVAQEMDGDKALKIAKEVLASKADEDTKKAAQAIVKKAEMTGKPVPIQFTAIDGRKIDLTKMQGKVVLVDFWATWCGPCIKELPSLKAAYDKLSSKGFEIVGISFDQDIDTLKRFVAKEKMTWPQYADGEGWDNKIGKEYGITSIPTMWLIDKKGNLRDTNAREDLTAKVEKLLAEK